MKFVRSLSKPTLTSEVLRVTEAHSLQAEPVPNKNLDADLPQRCKLWKRSISVSFLVAMLAVSACETTVINRGYVLETADFSKIKVGKDDARAVFGSFGSPTMRSSIKEADGGFSWYYVSKRTEKVSFLDPKVIDQKTMIVSFDKAGIVKSVKETTYEKPVSTVSEKTKTEGSTGGVLSETFGGLGKYLKPYTESDKK